MSHRLTLIVLATVLPFGTVSATSPDDEMGKSWKQSWDKENKALGAERDRLKAGVLEKFDSAIKGVDRQKGLTPAAKTDRRKQLETARKTFDEKGTFPPDDEFVRDELEYFLKVNKAAKPVSDLIDEVISKGSKTKNEGLEKQGVRMKADLEKQLGGGSKLVQGSVWHGELRRPNGNTIPYHLSISKMGEGGLFKGHVEDNPGVGGNWSYDVEGQTRALGVGYKMSKNLRGDFTAVAVEGIVSGDRLIARIESSAKGGKPSAALIVLKRVK